jgi:catalase
MANRNLKKDEKKNAQSVPFFARFLVGQDEKEADARKGDSRGRTLKFPSDTDEWDSVS